MKIRSNQSFPNQVKEHFKFLIEQQNFLVESEEYTESTYSEWMITLCSNVICIRVSIDKSQVFVDFGLCEKGKKWFDLMFLMMYSSQNLEWRYSWPTGKIDEENYDRQLAYLSGIVRENYEQLKETVTRILSTKGEEKNFERFIAKR